jgi:hypothetical protein
MCIFNTTSKPIRPYLRSQKPVSHHKSPLDKTRFVEQQFPHAPQRIESSMVGLSYKQGPRHIWRGTGRAIRNFCPTIASTLPSSCAPPWTLWRRSRRWAPLFEERLRPSLPPRIQGRLPVAPRALLLLRDRSILFCRGFQKPHRSSSGRCQGDRSFPLPARDHGQPLRARANGDTLPGGEPRALFVCRIFAGGCFE